MATDWAAAVAKMKGYVDTYLAIKTPNEKQKAALRTDLATLDKDLAGLAAQNAAPVVAVPATGDDPLLVPSQRIPGGALVSIGAMLDAGSIASVNGGNDPIPAAAQYAGQAEKEGFIGVIGSSGPNGIVYTVFVDGKVVATQPGDGTTDTAALGEQYGIRWN